MEPLDIPPISLIMRNLSIVGWASGTSIDSQDTLAFSVLTGVRADDRGLSAGARRGGL